MYLKQNVRLFLRHWRSRCQSRLARLAETAEKTTFQRVIQWYCGPWRHSTGQALQDYNQSLHREGKPQIIFDARLDATYKSRKDQVTSTPGAVR
jgi:hypothetical protein